jgi:PAS domain S-box-containing protein
MTRTMNGRIRSWDDGAEQLYGWRKEEAVGRVSHNLLQTQFPRPLEEIEAELLRSGRWQGKLVHTTRDGGRVVVESQWTLGLSGQPEAVIEINQRSTDGEMDTEACTDRVEIGRQEPLRASRLVKASDLLPRIANGLLIAGGVLCLAVLSHFVYYYYWTGQRSFTSPAGAFVYLVLPALLAIALFSSLRLAESQRVNLMLCLFSVAFTVYIVEVSATLWSTLPSVISAQDRQSKIEAAKTFGVKFDARTKAEVINDFRKRGIDAVPSLSPHELLKEQKDGRMKSATMTINGAEVLPLASIAEKRTVVCNEGGDFLTYTSDRHGFNNPPSVWDDSIDIVAVGDSFVQGWCVSPDDNFVSVIREQYPGTLNLGIEGNGPLVMLATLKEYAESVRPKVVLWFYFEGNDLTDLSRERRSPLLSRYLKTNEFSQRLSSRQDEIDPALARYLDTVANKNQLSVRLEEASAVITDADKLPKALESIAKLGQLRQRLGLMYGMTSNTPADVQLEKTPAQWVTEIDPFYEVLSQARKRVSQWGGSLYFVYLPGGGRYVQRQVNTGRPAVLQAVNKAGVPVIDLHLAFKEQKDPLALFPLRIPQHYNEAGHRLVAQEVLRAISLAN